ncbi:peptidylprolyl isomerase [Candidatus Woesearchaeota archaeon]|nr:MAG: peptidylprolyl isomerase [Candidatus Woesearchaeota archaeon]
MMMVKQGEFVKIEYTGRVKDSGEVFDTTDESVAKENNVYDPSAQYGARIICVGKGHVLKGLDAAIAEHKVGDSFTVSLKPEDAFGKKSAKLIQLISTGKFKKEGINPVPGMRVNVDNMTGTIKSVSGGRTLVDFNHPLAGKELVYEVRIVEPVSDRREQVAGMVEFYTGLKPVKVEYSSKAPKGAPESGEKKKSEKEAAAEGKEKKGVEKAGKPAEAGKEEKTQDKDSVTVYLSTAIPEEIQKIIGDKIKEIVSVKNISFAIGKE